MYCLNAGCSELAPCKTHGCETKGVAGVILVTGGTGFIGSHTILELARANYKCVVVDNLSNSSRESLVRVGILSGRPDLVDFFQVDICNRVALEEVFERYKQPFDACIHFAGLKAVGESVAKPLQYYQNNITGTLVLLDTLGKYGCRNLIFSSSATVYGEPSGDPAHITEDYKLNATNPYGRTKLFIEEILRDVAQVGGWKICLLRYFNPIGNDSSGQIGESPNGIPNNLFPLVLQVVGGRRAELSVFGTDFPTIDGTGVRDYIHVVDLAKGHLAALKEAIFGNAMQSPCEAFNLGSGVGASVLQMVEAMNKITGKELPVRKVGRRPGDVAVTVCDPSKANVLLKWRAEKTIDEACADGLRWQTLNPNGYP